ncbi:proteasome regulatory particle subunit [Malassezia cuniculi]|uniref:Proteasome regulatory particle subunit n=1 Tax=Malassezia cuniculi TaxID=948313 RepID=A0AAF0ERR3_9BASI|nr:proteasome regulatory particle subunit [Malassezia cuniculi]
MSDVRYESAPDVAMDVDDDPSVRRRGRGFDSGASANDGVRSSGFERLAPADLDERAERSVEGWVVVVTNVHSEATEDDVLDAFLDFGKVKDLHLNLDRRTGYVKGYALLKFEHQDEASRAIEACKNGLTLMEQQLDADYAFVRAPLVAPGAGRPARRDVRERSPSPMR